MSAIANEIVRDADVSAPAEAIKPPRLNFARICLYCDGRDCESPQCIALYEASYWAVCPECRGLCWSETYEPCGCMFGVVEAWPPTKADRLSAV
jgi:hypothetical protein